MSPHGSKIAFYLGAPRQMELYVMNADGSAMVNLNMPSSEALLSWSPLSHPSCTVCGLSQTVSAIPGP